MRTLDCETIDTAYESLANIIDVAHPELSGVFDSIAPGRLVGESPEGWPTRWRRLFSFVQEETRCRAHFDATCWFHCTRTWDHAFREGLLPQSLAEERIWQFLYQLVRDPQMKNRWEEVREGAQRSPLYSERRQGGSSEDGPFGLLIRESAMAACHSPRFVNYFDLPELVDYICRADILQGTDLAGEYRARTKPTIVKFRTKCHRADELRVAVFYAYAKRHGLDVTESCNWCYCGKGRGIPKEDILKVEVLS